MKIMLFTTNTCPYCVPAKELLMKSGIPDIQYINASEKDNMKLATEFKIRSVPALVVVKDGKNETYTGVDGVQNFIDSYKA